MLFLKISSPGNLIKLPYFMHCILAYGRNYMSNKKQKMLWNSVAYHPLTLREFCKSLLQKTWSISIPQFSQTIFFLQKNVWVLDPYSKSTLFTFCKRLYFNYVNGSTIKQDQFNSLLLPQRKLITSKQYAIHSRRLIP